MPQKKSFPDINVLSLLMNTKWCFLLWFRLSKLYEKCPKINPILSELISNLLEHKGDLNKVNVSLLHEEKTEKEMFFDAMKLGYRTVPLLS